MEEHLIELSVGESIQIGQHMVTLVDVVGDELCLEIEGEGQMDAAFANIAQLLESV